MFKNFIYFLPPPPPGQTAPCAPVRLHHLTRTRFSRIIAVQISTLANFLSGGYKENKNKVL